MYTYCIVFRAVWVNTSTNLQIWLRAFRRLLDLKTSDWASYEHLCNPCKVNYSHVVYMENMKDDIGIVLDLLKNPDGPRPTLPARNTIRDTTDRAAELSQHFKNIDPDILNGNFHEHVVFRPSENTITIIRRWISKPNNCQVVTRDD